jgi:hypothetical protein
MFIILLLYVWFEHPGHTYGGFVSAFLERGMTLAPNDSDKKQGMQINK